MPEPSLAVTTIENADPATLEAGTELMTRLPAPAEFTVMLDEVVEMEPVWAVTVCEPAVTRVRSKVPTPAESAVGEGRMAEGSEDVKLV